MSISQASARQLVERYFETFNQAAFEQTAALFAESGQLIPPFEGAIVGSESILSYLNKQACDMHAQPQEWNVHSKDADQWQVEVIGKVKAMVFQVNVNWQFEIAPTGELESATIRLIASPKELLSLRSTTADSAVAT